MPEMPEVETLRRSLVRARVRAPIRDVWRSDKALRTGETWRKESLRSLVGATPLRLTRRGKFLLWTLRSADDERLGWLVHLGMTGRFLVTRGDAPLEPHTHVVVHLDGDDRQLRFVDPRRFGGMRVAPLATLRADKPLCDLGPEPLARDFGGDMLAARAGRSKRALRDVLLDQRVVAGVGNIYMNEALFEARLHPLAKAHRLRAAAWQELAVAVQSVLQRGLDNRGTTLRDYRDAQGRRGDNQHALAVYGRAGEPCTACASPLRGVAVGGRTTTYCPQCQRRRR